MTNQPDHPNKPSDCTAPTELNLFEPADRQIAGRWVMGVSKLPENQRPVSATRTAAGNTPGDAILDEIGLTNIPVGSTVHFHYWDGDAANPPKNYHVMVPTSNLINEGHEWAKCLDKAAAGAGPAGESKYPLSEEYSKWKNNDVEPLNFFFYRLGEYTFGHCGG